MKSKTNSMRVLDSRSIAYEAFEFSPDVRSAEEAGYTVTAHEVTLYGLCRTCAKERA